MNKLIIFFCFFCIIICNYNTQLVKAEEGVAGISTTLNKNIVNVTYYYTTNRVNLRKESNVNSDIIITLEKRTKVLKMPSSDNGWTQIMYEDKIGWINSKYLRDTELPVIEFTDTEIEMLYRITEAEATGKSIEAKENVVSCIINRVYDSDFPDTIKDVIFEKNQYSPVKDGRYCTVIITEETKEAVNNVIKNGTTHDYTYFCNYDIISRKLQKWFDTLEFGFKDSANHSYYK